jgi:putative ABC transport system permease protein
MSETRISIYQVAAKNLLRKKTRTLLTILGIGLSAWVLTSLFGFNRGYEAALNKDIDNMGFQVLLTAKGCPYEAATLMLKGGTGLRYMPEAVFADILKNPEVERITPMLMQAVFDPNKGESGGISAYLGIDPATYPGMKSFLKFRQGAWFTSPEAREAVLGYEAAELEQREVGDKILVLEKNVEYTVVGILGRSGTQDDGTIFVPIRTLQKDFSQEGKVTAVGIKVRKDADIAGLENKLYELPDVQVVSMAQVKTTILSLVATAKVMVFSIALIAILIAMIGVINTILMSVFERFQEIGIIKSMGAMPRDVFRMIWTETVILCLLGGLLGVGLSFGLSQLTDLLIRRLLPYTPTGSLIIVNPALALMTLAIVLVIGLLSGIYPAWRASRVRPLESIRSEGE